MSRALAALCGTGLLALLSVGRAHAAIEIEHSALSCVTVDRYTRVAARATGTLAGADLQFRVDPGGGWYAVSMVEHGGEWSGFLPRPGSAVRQIEYRIVMTGTDATSATTPALMVPAREASGCDPGARASVEAPIAITVPAGAPAVPPVPPGFSPAGVVGARERTSMSRTMKLAGVVAGAAVLGGTVAGVAGASAHEPDRPPPKFPTVRLSGTSPAPGSAIVANRDQVVIRVELGLATLRFAVLDWTVQFISDAAERTCLTMSGAATVALPALVELTGPLEPAAGCGTRFDTDFVQVTISHGDTTFYDQGHAVPFRFQQ